MESRKRKRIDEKKSAFTADHAVPVVKAEPSSVEPQPHTGFDLVDTKMRIRLAPRLLGDPRKGISDTLNLVLLRYWEPVRGTPLTVEEFSVHESKGYLATDVNDASVFVSVRVQFLVFAPRPGTLLTAKVLRVAMTQGGSQQVDVQVHGVFSGHITGPAPVPVPAGTPPKKKGKRRTKDKSSDAEADVDSKNAADLDRVLADERRRKAMLALSAGQMVRVRVLEVQPHDVYHGHKELRCELIMGEGEATALKPNPD